MDIEARDSSPDKQASDELDSSPDKSDPVEDHFGSLSVGTASADVLDSDSTDLEAVPGIPCVADLSIAVAEEAALVEDNADKTTSSAASDTHNKEFKKSADSAVDTAAANKHCDNITTHSNSDMDAHVLDEGVGDDDGLGSKLGTAAENNKVINDESD